MLAAIIGLIGGLAGVTVGAFLTEWREQRHTRRDRVEASRVAARLVAQELRANYTRVLGSTGNATMFETTAWKEHRAVLARQMDEDGWGFLASAYSALELASSGSEPLGRDGDGMVKRAEARLHGLVHLTRDANSEDQVVDGYVSYLERRLAKKQMDEARRAVADGGQDGAD